MVDYTTFRVLLDEPARDPQLGFDVYAQSFAEIIEHSDAQFAIGIFGEWGSGKTTLMRAIQAKLADSANIVTVWFNAWRYEREPHLIVPILDTVREALVEWAERNPEPTRGRTAAGAIGRAAKALLAGMSVSANLPGFGLSFDGDKILAELREPAEEAADDPQSFFHAGFRAMREAVAAFAYDDPRTGTAVNRRIVIFVDDLDRCLPSKALQVLESIKVMFDLPGIIFVAGLAQSVIDQAVGDKYKEIDGLDDDGLHGSDYSNKLFQVPFALPRIQTDQLPDYFSALAQTPGLPPDQVKDLTDVVGPHLSYLSGDDTVNPREIKRFINAYTLQVKMLDRKLGPGQLRPEAVLALQAMNFRSEWRGLYELLAEDPVQFREAISQAMADPDPGGLWIGAKKEPLPVSFLGYMGAEGAGLLEVEDLGPYVTSAEFTRSTDPAISKAQSALREVRRAVGTLAASEDLDSETASLFKKAVDQLGSRSPSGGGRLVQGFRHRVEDLHGAAGQLNPDGWAERRAGWLEATVAPLAEIAQVLSELRRRATVGNAS